MGVETIQSIVSDVLKKLETLLKDGLITILQEKWAGGAPGLLRLAEKSSDDLPGQLMNRCGVGFFQKAMPVSNKKKNKLAGQAEEVLEP